MGQVNTLAHSITMTIEDCPNMSKDLATWQMSCILEELFHINDRIIQGDCSSWGGLKKAQTFLADHQASLQSLPGMVEAWVQVSSAYGGFVQISWRFVWNDGDIQRGNAIPVRK
jgi:hypothetical protein